MGVVCRVLVIFVKFSITSCTMFSFLIARSGEALCLCTNRISKAFTEPNSNLKSLHLTVKLVDWVRNIKGSALARRNKNRDYFPSSSCKLDHFLLYYYYRVNWQESFVFCIHAKSVNLLGFLLSLSVGRKLSTDWVPPPHTCPNKNITTEIFPKVPKSWLDLDSFPSSCG